ncbi:hypothetical protein P5673_020866 [Acropora cervicornis]|uniref:Uncharacterized protein n=1 Tax=Acropora cervicornis TaxID=6130 RepID=A0AAD9Q9E1_ACRCE|nr:hypothetical protein P5673_020866 [Acropora cervicornis]
MAAMSCSFEPRRDFRPQSSDFAQWTAKRQFSATRCLEFAFESRGGTSDFRLQTLHNGQLRDSPQRRVVLNFTVNHSGSLQTSDFRLQTSDFRLQTSDSRLQTPDFRLQT